MLKTYPNSKQVPFALLAFLVALAAAFVVVPFAHASELDDVRDEIDEKVAELDELTEKAEAADARIHELEGRIEELTDQIAEKEAVVADLQATSGELARAMYKHSDDLNFVTILVNSETLSEMSDRMVMREKVLGEFSRKLEKQKSIRAELADARVEAEADKEEQGELLGELEEQQQELNEKIDELKEREEELDYAHRVAVALAAAAAHEIPEPFDTDADEEDSGEPSDLKGWHTGAATAYGGETDEYVENPSPTATGDVCDDWSVGVAIPISWGSKYYGMYVEVSYDGKSIIAPVNDCGGMDGVHRILDLQPGVWKAFGAESCDEWGERQVRYRFLEG